MGTNKLSTPKLGTDKCKHNMAHSSTNQSTCPNKDTCQLCVTCADNADVMRSKAGSYLMAAKGLPKKVNRIDTSLSLINLKY